MAYLEIKTDRGFKRIELEGKTISVGRAPGNTVVVDDDRASRKHCIIEPENGQFRLRDLGSRNGTRVNGVRLLDEAEVSPGDRVSFGDARFRLAEASRSGAT